MNRAPDHKTSQILSPGLMTKKGVEEVFKDGKSDCPLCI